MANYPVSGSAIGLNAVSPDEALRTLCDPLPEGVLEHESQWYETSPGHRRLAYELSEIERSHGRATFSILPNGRMTFRFRIAGTDIQSRHLIVVCKSNHPTAYPNVVIEEGATIVVPQPNGPDIARHLYETVQRCQALDRYHRAVRQEALSVAQYPLVFQRGGDPENQDIVAAHTQWYLTELGKRRLADELLALSNAQLASEPRVLPSGDLALVFAGVLFNHDKIVTAVFPCAYPKLTARILVGSGCAQETACVDSTQPPFLSGAPLLVEALAVAVGVTW